MKLAVITYDKLFDLLDGEIYYESRNRCGDWLYTQYYIVKEDGIYTNGVDEEKRETTSEIIKILNFETIDLNKIVSITELYDMEAELEDEDEKYG